MGETYGSAVETQFANDLVQVARNIRGGAEPELLTQANFGPERLLYLQTRRSAAYKGLYALQMKNGSADWRSGEPLIFADIHTKSVDIHHIFPKRWCQKESQPAIPYDLVESIINKTPIDSFTNQLLGGHAPSKYLLILREYIEKEKLQRVLRAHWIDPDGLENDAFGHCFVERGQEMLDLITSTMGKPQFDGRHVFREALKSASLSHDQFDVDEVDHDPIGESTYSATVQIDGTAI